VDGVLAINISNVDFTREASFSAMRGLLITSIWSLMGFENWNTFLFFFISIGPS